MTGLLAGKRAVITGASRGIGLGIAEVFLQEGASVLMIARDGSVLEAAARQLQTSVPDAQLYVCARDMCAPKQAEQARQFAEQSMDGVDIVVANIGGGSGSGDALSDPKEWQAMWDKNFNTAVETSRAFMPLLQTSKGNMIFISSIAGLEVLGAPTGYSAAKAALGALSKNLAYKLAPKVRVNTVAPGNILCDTGTWAEKLAADHDGVKKMLNEKVPLKRFGTAQEIGDAVAFLASDKAAFITGATLVIDGGQTVGIG